MLDLSLRAPERRRLIIIEAALRKALPSFDKLYTWRVPGRLVEKIRVGQLVRVPFGRGNRSAEAFVWAVQDDPSGPEQTGLKEIEAILDAEPVLNPDQLTLAAAMRLRYACTYGDAAGCMIPPPAKLESAIRAGLVSSVYLTDRDQALDICEGGRIRYANQLAVLEFLLTYGETAVAEVLEACGVSRSTLKTLEKKGLLTFAKIKVEEEKGAPATPVTAEFSETVSLEPTDEQVKAIEAVRQSIQAGTGEEFLLHGITGSGKTEVYLQIAKKLLAEGRGAIVLVPEIALTPQIHRRFESCFGSRVAVLHSRLTGKERLEAWQKVRRGQVQLVLGTRSAVFAPVRNLALVVIDEEQEESYQSDLKPRYRADSVARLRCKITGATLLLGSATPSVESFYRTQSGQARLLCLTKRAGPAVLPTTHIVDMRNQFAAGRRDIFSQPLEEALRASFSKGEQAIIFLNRRGYAGGWLCRHCGEMVGCRACDVSLTLHRGSRGQGGRLQCHYCGRIERPPSTCPVCGSHEIGPSGFGTQQAEERFKELFPEQKILRMDGDTTLGRKAHESILERFAKHEADALLGTQMIAKGHDFPAVTTVGILSADQLTGMADFRAAERAFQLITQAAGRAGRANLAGSVYIQAYDIDHYAIRHAAAQDYEGFYREETAYRQSLQYPPFGALGFITIMAESEAAAAHAASQLHRRLLQLRNTRTDLAEVEILPPAPAPVSRINYTARSRLVLKAKAEKPLAMLLYAAARLERPPGVGLSLRLDPA